MNSKSIEKAKNPLLAKSLPAMQRAANAAYELAAQTGTAIVVMQKGKLVKIWPGSVREPSTEYKAD